MFSQSQHHFNFSTYFQKSYIFFPLPSPSLHAWNRNISYLDYCNSLQSSISLSSFPPFFLDSRSMRFSWSSHFLAQIILIPNVCMYLMFFSLILQDICANFNESKINILLKLSLERVLKYFETVNGLSNWIKFKVLEKFLLPKSSHLEMVVCLIN